MTHTIDNFLIRHGFEAVDVSSVKHRNLLYVAIIAMSLCALTFSSLAAQAWF
jgi:hypothetical protein